MTFCQHWIPKKKKKCKWNTKISEKLSKLVLGRPWPCKHFPDQWMSDGSTEWWLALHHWEKGCSDSSGVNIVIYILCQITECQSTIRQIKSWILWIIDFQLLSSCQKERKNSFGILFSTRVWGWWWAWSWWGWGEGEGDDEGEGAAEGDEEAHYWLAGNAWADWSPRNVRPPFIHRRAYWELVFPFPISLLVIHIRNLYLDWLSKVLWTLLQKGGLVRNGRTKSYVWMRFEYLQFVSRNRKGWMTRGLNWQQRPSSCLRSPQVSSHYPACTTNPVPNKVVTTHYPAPTVASLNCPTF